MKLKTGTMEINIDNEAEAKKHKKPSKLKLRPIQVKRHPESNFNCFQASLVGRGDTMKERDNVTNVARDTEVTDTNEADNYSITNYSVSSYSVTNYSNYSVTNKTTTKKDIRGLEIYCNMPKSDPIKPENCSVKINNIDDVETDAARVEVETECRRVEAQVELSCAAPKNCSIEIISDCSDSSASTSAIGIKAGYDSVMGKERDGIIWHRSEKKTMRLIQY